MELEGEPDKQVVPSSAKELQEAEKNMKRGKVQGIDEIPTDIMEEVV